MPKLTAAVGINTVEVKNKPQDVALVSTLLWTSGFKSQPTTKITNGLIEFIKKAQKAAKADAVNGVIKPGDKTMQFLNKNFLAEQRKQGEMLILKHQGNIKVSKSVYELERKRALTSLDTYSKKMLDAHNRLAEGHNIVKRCITAREGFLSFVAMRLAHTVSNVQYPKAALGNASSAAVKNFRAAVKSGDFKKIQNTMPVAEKAFNAWSDEMARWWEEATGGRDRLQFGIGVGKTAGWVAVGIFVTPAATAVAGTAGGIALAGGGSKVLEASVNQLVKQVNGQGDPPWKVAKLMAWAAAEGVLTSFAGYKLGGLVDDLAKVLAPRVVARIPSLSLPVAEGWVKRVLLNPAKGALEGIVSDALKSAAQDTDKTGKPPKAKTWTQYIADRVWDAALSSIVGDLETGLNKKWGPATDARTATLVQSAAAKKGAADDLIKAMPTKFAGESGKLGIDEVKKGVVDTVVSRATGKEKPDKIAQMAQSILVARPDMKKLVNKFADEAIKDAPPPTK